jgi:hypothetical protein
VELRFGHVSVPPRKAYGRAIKPGLSGTPRHDYRFATRVFKVAIIMSIESPCVKVCTYEAGSGLCSACGRTLDEIARWSQLRDEERRRIMAELPARLSKIPRKYSRD